jgi:hypothetical protein
MINQLSSSTPAQRTARQQVEVRSVSASQAYTDYGILEACTPLDQDSEE